MKYRNLNHKGVELDKKSLEIYLEKLASDQIIQNYSSKDTYPIPKLKENFEFIRRVYNLLNEHIKLGIPIHPAGEWLLDNFYIIEESEKNIIRNMPLKRYKDFLGVANGPDKGFARIYVLSYDIVNYTDNNIKYNNIIDFLKAYQRKKTLSMQEIWNMGIFMQISIIQNIRGICEKIYFSQMQKYRAENIIERLIEKSKEQRYRNLIEYKTNVKGYGEMKYPFIEYLSYRLKEQGKVSIPFLLALEEQVSKMGTSIDEVIKKEHYDIALKKVSMANCITSMKELIRMDFLSIFEQTNEVEEILKQDPAKVYSKMDYKTKEYYRNKIEEISNRTKIAEIYIAQKALELSKENINNQNIKKSHVGYYLIDKGKKELFESIQQKEKSQISDKAKVKIYIYGIWTLALIIDILCMYNIEKQVKNLIITIIFGVFFILPIQEIVVKIIQYVLSKVVKPKLIPKMDFYAGVPEEYSTFVVIPTILKDKKKIKELMRKLEVYYLANKSENIYFALLGDCSSGCNKEESFDSEVIEEGLKQAERLNKKYINKKEEIPKFYFIYRERKWNSEEECYLGWERKRGLLNQFNEYILGKIQNPFLVNTIDNQNFEKIKYVITLDADTELVLNTGLELIGSMAHILNWPVLNKNKDLVIDGYGIMQPRVGINIEATNKSLFTKIFAGMGGIDPYANAISDIYQDNFKEGIFTGKGIYDIKVFSQVLNDEIPENTVLSHDLLEGSYLRCGLVSDIVLMDGYPSSYNSSKLRMHRWIRGDFQITRWANNKIIDKKGKIKENPLNTLSRYKIMDNIFRAVTPITIILLFILICILKTVGSLKITGLMAILFITIAIPALLDIINRIVYHKEGQSYQRTFTPRIPSLVANLERVFLEIISLPDKAYYSFNAIVKTIYRLCVSNKYLLEWVTSEEAERISKKDLLSYYKNMLANVFIGIITLIFSLCIKDIGTSVILFVLSMLWLIAPTIFWYISKDVPKDEILNKVATEDKEYLLEIGKRTWKYFKDTIIERNNYLVPDNYQEDRKEEFVNRTSSTNIGLSLLAVISSYDLGYESLEDTMVLLNNILKTIEKLPKWNGHLYNWYNIKTLEPLIPRYISTVDSGNFVGYVYVLQSFYKEIKEKTKNGEIEEKEKIFNLIPEWVDEPLENNPIANADFSKLYDGEKGLFSIGFNIEEGKLTDSYYDLLASEARQASLVAISKKDVEAKHWNNLGRIMTTMYGYNGLISWSGTAFEYLMPNVIIKSERGSLIDESIKFMIMSQKEYAKKLGIPWGFSEAAYYLKDLNNNYQYKAIGIPWLGLKRGLEEDIVVSSYASIMALSNDTKEVIQNIKNLEKQGMYNKYGFYESIDYSPIRLKKGKKQMVVNTYMAHHQGLILLSINNFFNKNILQKRFSQNEQISAVEVLLQENMPENRIITKEEKIKPEKTTYLYYENYAQRIFKKTNEILPICNVIANNDYTVVMDERANGYSKYKNYLINRFKPNSDEIDGIYFYIKNIKNKRIWTSNATDYIAKPDKYEITFTEDSDKIKRLDGGIQTNCKVTLAQKDNVEIRMLEVTNNGVEEETLEITSILEPILASLETYNSHPAFQNLFLEFEYNENEDIFIIKRKNRQDSQKGLYLAISLYTEDKEIGKVEYEIDKEKLAGRENFFIPDMVENSKPFSNKIKYVTDPILALRKTIKIKPEETVKINLLLSVSEEKNLAVENVKEYQNIEKINKSFEIALARADTQTRYLNINAKQINTYQKMLGYILFSNPLQNKNNLKSKYYPKEELWQYGISGDLPILLVKVGNSNEKENLREILKAYQFFKLKNIQVDLVLFDVESNSYEKYTKEMIQNEILNANLGYLQNTKSGIFVFENENPEIIEFYAKLIIDTKKGPILRQIEDLEEEYIENQNKIGENLPTQYEIYNEEHENEDTENTENLLYYNEYGGFSKDGKEYRIKLNKKNKLPTVWSHILANDKFGTLVTDSLGGYTWSKNSRLNRITSFSNNQVLDNPSEIIYLQDAETLKTWSIGLNPMPDNNNYKVEYGFGYAKYKHTSMQIEQNLTVFVPRNDSVKISILELKNLNSNSKTINLIYYINPVLGEDEINANRYINIDFQENKNIVLMENKTNTDFKEIVYISSNEKIKSYTGSRRFFIGNSNIAFPEGIKKVMLNNESNIGDDNICAIKLEIDLEAYEKKQIVILLGAEEKLIDIQDKVYKYTNIGNVKEELEEVRNQFSNILERVQVKTPMESFNILMNGWLIYQTITSRMKARTGFYQSGGAFGFRDQLQDTIALKYFDTDILKNQIIKHSKHQFMEGDVEHWWHEETSRGIRTRFSDDLLWLVYLVVEYIKSTNDLSILKVKTNYVEGNKLEEKIDERYDKYIEIQLEESIFMHCKRALNKAINLGENGLPKIGSGDWNDGFSKVGNKGKGESVWLGFFLYDILIKWIEICKRIKEEGIEELNIEIEEIEYYKQLTEKIKKNLNSIGWDGRWFRRAFTDNGEILGTIQNEECKIDGISQSWSVISKAGDNDKKYISMESLENHLVDKENGIIKLLDPPFEKSKLEPGYIKAYLPGTRENGGQYTHAAIWAIIAEAMLGFGDKAVELFRMINPIEHARTKETASKYKVEPYVVAADIYGQKNLSGRGGWTWYTGSSSWMYEAGIHYILGLTIENGYLSINPCISADWKEYEIRYKYGNSICNIKVENYNRKNTGVETMIVNGYVIEDKKVKLNKDGGIYNIEIIM